MHDLKDKRVLITGGATGIGAALARAFAGVGAKVAIHYNSSEAEAIALTKAIDAAGGQSIAFQADLARRGAAEHLINGAAAILRGLDVLINNAGDMVKRAPLDAVDDALFDQVIDVNIRSAVMVSRAAIAHFLRAGQGNIINTGSIAARNGGGPGAALYASSKGFLQTFTRAAAREYAPRNIRVNAVAPGVIVTPFHARHTSPEALESFRKAIPLGRLGTPDDCVGAYLFLASDALSGYITGQVIEVNGGQLMP